MLTLRKVTVLSLALLMPAVALAEAPAGKVVLLTGRATALSTSGQVRTLTKNDAVFSGELINSGLGSYVNLHFSDGGFFLLRPETRFQIEDYRYDGPEPKLVAPKATDPNGSVSSSAPPAIDTATAPLVTAQTGSNSQTSRAFFRLLKGGFRSVSGLVGKISQDDYRVITPVATIGIRGTLYSARLCQGDCADRSEIAAKLRTSGSTSAANETILVTTVEQGEIGLTTAKETRNQRSGVVLLSSSNGGSVQVETPPATEQSEQNIDPKACQ